MSRVWGVIEITIKKVDIPAQIMLSIDVYKHSNDLQFVWQMTDAHGISIGGTAMSSLKALTGFFLLAAGVVQAQSSFDAQRCDECTGSSAMESVALQANGSPPHAYTTYVYSVPYAEVRKFHVERYCGSNPRGSADPAQLQPRQQQVECQWWAHIVLELPVEPVVSGFVEEMRQVHQAYGNSFHAFEHVHFTELSPLLSGMIVGMRGGNDEPDAYDFVEHSNTRNSILSVYNSILDARANPHFITRLMRGTVSFASQGINIRFNMDGSASLRSKLEFNDGSSVMIQTLSNPDMAVYVQGTAVDSQGVPIPDPSYNPHTGSSPGGGYIPGTHDPVADPQRWCQMAAVMMGITCGGDGSNGVVCGRVNDGPVQCMRI